MCSGSSQAQVHWTGRHSNLITAGSLKPTDKGDTTQNLNQVLFLMFMGGALCRTLQTRVLQHVGKIILLLSDYIKTEKHVSWKTDWSIFVLPLSGFVMGKDFVWLSARKCLSCTELKVVHFSLTNEERLLNIKLTRALQMDSDTDHECGTSFQKEGRWLYWTWTSLEK